MEKILQQVEKYFNEWKKKFTESIKYFRDRENTSLIIRCPDQDHIGKEPDQGG
jgi:hypothetical protein